MAFWKKEEKTGRFQLDDKVRKALDDMTNTDEALQLLDLLGEHQRSIEHAIDAVVALDESGVFDVITAHADPRAPEPDLSDSAPFVHHLHHTLTALNGLDPDTLDHLLSQLPDGTTLDLDAFDNPPSISPFEAVRQLRDPAVQRGLGKLVVLLRALGQAGSEE